MLRILAKISIYGSKAALGPLMEAALIQDGKIKQVGTSRKKPELDSWSYSSPWYEFHVDEIDNEIHDFLVAHERLGAFLCASNGRCVSGMEYAVLSLCPVGQNAQEYFSCFFGREILGALLQSGLALEIAPASTLPEAQYWKR